MGGSLGWTGNILGNIRGIFLRRAGQSGTRLGWTRLEARLGLGVNGAAWLKYGARARQSSSTSSARGLRVVVCAESSGGACGLPRSPVKLILTAVSSSWWALHYGMIKTCFWQLWKFRYTPKLFCFLTNEALIQLLVGGTTGGGFETLRGDKTQSFITQTEAYN